MTTEEFRAAVAAEEARGAARGRDNDSLFGLLGQALQVRPEFALAYASAILTSVAGPVASIKGVFGERHSESLSLLVDGPASSLERALSAIFFEPVERFNNLSRLAAQSVAPDLLTAYDEENVDPDREVMRSGMARELLSHARNLVEGKLDPWEDIAMAAGARRRLAQLQTPSLMIHHPHPETLDGLMGDVLDGRPLIVDLDGRILRNSLSRGKSASRWLEMVDTLERYQGGGSDVIRKGKDGSGVAAHIKAPFLIHERGGRLGQALEEPILGRLLSRGLILHPTRIKRQDPPDFPSIKSAVEKYSECLSGVILARRDGTGVRYEIRQPEPKFWERLECYHDYVDGLAKMPGSQYCLGLRDLPYALLWTALVLTGRDLNVQTQGTLHVSVMDAADFLARHHVERVSLTLHKHQLQEQLTRMQAFFDRVEQNGPCKPRDIYRCYGDQRTELHEPILKNLVRIGAVRFRQEDHKLEIVPGGGPPWNLEEIAQAIASGLS